MNFCLPKVLLWQPFPIAPIPKYPSPLPDPLAVGLRWGLALLSNFSLLLPKDSPPSLWCFSLTLFLLVLAFSENIFFRL